MKCKHPATRLYTWFAYNCITNKNDWLCIVCLDCNKVLKGGHREFDKYLNYQLKSKMTFA